MRAIQKQLEIIKKRLTKFRPLLILTIALIFNSCSDESFDSTTENRLTSLEKEMFAESIMVKNNTTYLTSFLYKLGINKITTTVNNDIYTYKLNSAKEWISVNGERIYLNDLNFTLNNNGLVLNNESNSLLSLEEKLYVVNRKNNSKKEFEPEDAENMSLILTALVLKEITSSNELKVNVEQNSYRSSCSIWDTYVITNSGFTRSVAQDAGELEARLAESLCDMQGSSCSQMGSVDTSCVWENHLCMSSSTWCCPDNDPCY